MSVVIPNYNYGDYVADAVSSVLALDWPDVEIVVVDDGSTDRSRDVLADFGDRITLVLQENRGQREACNVGFALTTGDAVVFLDSDDLLEPAFARRVAERWSEHVSKIQVQMLRVDDGNKRGRGVTPRFRSEPSPKEITRWMRCTTAYPTPPGSGNVYARSFLERIMPLDARIGDFADSGCLAAAPLMGDVVTVRRPLVRYRSHDRNDSDLLAAPGRFAREIQRALDRYWYAMDVTGGSRSSAPLRRSRELLQFRAADHRMRHGRPILLGDRLGRLLLDAIRSPLHPGPESFAWRAAVMVWVVAVLISPGSIAQRLIVARYERS